MPNDTLPTAAKGRNFKSDVSHVAGLPTSSNRMTDVVIARREKPTENPSGFPIGRTDMVSVMTRARTSVMPETR